MRAYRLEPAGWQQFRGRGYGQDDGDWLSWIAAERGLKPALDGQVDEGQLQLIYEAIENLPDDLREILLMRCNGLSFPSIAELLGEEYHDGSKAPSNRWHARFDLAVGAVRKQLTEKRRAKAVLTKRGERNRRQRERAKHDEAARLQWEAKLARNREAQRERRERQRQERLQAQPHEHPERAS